MENKKYSKVNLVSSNLLAERLDELRKIFPEAFIENRVDSKKLMEVLGDKADGMAEKFGFMWAGKGNAIKNVLIPSKATLKPAKDESVKFDESENIFIEGDNLEVLKLLQKAYFEKVKMIYIDPPYNTGGDFVYKDNFTAPLKGYLEQTGQVDGDGNKMQTNRETSGRYHSDWLSMMYPRLKLAWNFLRDDGVIFVSIDDNEVHHLRMLMDEIFGEENFIAQIIIQSNKRGQTYKEISKTHEYLICYSKNPDILLSELEKEESDLIYNDDLGDFNIRELRNRNPKFGKFNRPNLYFPIYANPNVCDKNKLCLVSLKKDELFSVPVFPINSEGGESCWRWSTGLVKKNNNSDIDKTPLVAKQKKGGGWNVYEKYRKMTYRAKSIWDETGVISEQGTIDLKELGLKELFSHPKPVHLLKKILQIGSAVDEDCIILDFFAGSGTMAQAVLELNKEDGGTRKFILVQLPEMTAADSNAYKAGYKFISDMTKERIRRAINGYGDNPQLINDGFKVFKLGKSNYLENGFDFDPEKSEEENKKAFLEYLNKARQVKLFGKNQEIDVVYENIIKEGLSLNAKIEKQKIAGAEIYKITDGEKQLLICLENKISLEVVNEFRKVEYKGRIFICLDNALDDTAKANLGLNVELKTI